jgi:hypothetical protein
VDIPVPEDFPKADYLEVERRIAVYMASLGPDAAVVPVFAGYIGGWHALIMRFRAADEDRSVATKFLARPQGDLSLEDRYLQERALFGFFGNAMSTVECCCFSIYHLGRMRCPTRFAASDREVDVRLTATEVAEVFPCTSLDTELSALRADTTWRSLKEIRHTLVHRESPGITIFATAGAGAATAPPAKWTDRGVVLEPALVDNPRTWLCVAVTRLVSATLAFVSANF